MIADHIAGGEEGPATTAAWDLLGRVLRPLMWRNTKSVVAQEFHLPHRTLRPTWLAFQAGERAFYEQARAEGVVGSCVAASRLGGLLLVPSCLPCHAPSPQHYCCAGGGAGAAVT